MTGQSNFPIFPSSKDEFNWKVVDARIKFLTDDKGNVTGAIHYQNGQQINVKRLKDEAPVTVNPSVFDKYVGKYDLGNSNIVEVTKDGDKLMVKALNIPKFQLLPASETEYFAKEVSARVKFRVVAGDKADAILINWGDGNERIANRIKE